MVPAVLRKYGFACLMIRSYYSSFCELMRYGNVRKITGEMLQ